MGCYPIHIHYTCILSNWKDLILLNIYLYILMYIVIYDYSTLYEQNVTIHCVCPVYVKY